MQCERLTAIDGDPVALAAQLRALVPTGASVGDRVAEIIGEVRAKGDAALKDYTRRFDTAGAEPSAIEVPAADMDVALERLDRDVRAGLERAIDNVGTVARAGLRHELTVVDFDGHQVLLREIAVRRAGIYVPGGRAPYPSTVVMGVVTARVAGVSDVAVCAPPGTSGEVDPTVLAGCRLAGATRVYAMGGAQAVAALAYGTETVEAVDVIVGPGNLYVQEAKRQVSGDVGIDGFAGPSDLFVVAAERKHHYKGPRNRAEPPQRTSQRSQRNTPDSGCRIHYPPRRSPDPAQQEGKKIPRCDVHVVPRVLAHGVIVESPCVHLPQSECHDVLEPQRDHKRRMPQRFHLINLQRQPEHQRRELNDEADADQSDPRGPHPSTKICPLLQQQRHREHRYHLHCGRDVAVSP